MSGPLEYCTLLAANGDVWLDIYQENNQGQKGSLKYPNVHLGRGERFPVQFQSGRMRFDYKTVAGDPMHGNVGVSCHRNDVVEVP